MGKNYLEQLGKLILAAKLIAKKYRKLTGRPLGITREVAEYEAARLLKLELAPVRQLGFDAIYKINNTSCRVQIKGRCILDSSKKNGRVSKIRLDCDWDFVLLVLLDHDFEPISIHKALRKDVEMELKRPGSKARNIKGSLSISKFKSISQLVWSKAS